MSADLFVSSGQTFVFPVAIDHPLGKYQNFRLATAKEILTHPFYSKIIRQHRDFPTVFKGHLDLSNIVEEALPTPLMSLITRLKISVGQFLAVQLADITIEVGASLTFNNIMTSLSANNIKIGGTLRAVSPNSAHPATLILNCNSLGGL